MLKCFTILAVWTLTTSMAIAEISNKEYAKCAAIEGALVRLECFDNLARDKQLDEEQVVSTGFIGKWTVSEDINPIDDSKTVRLLLFADSEKGKKGKPIFAIARCKRNKTELYISWGDYLGGAEIKTVTRADKQKAVTTNWHVSSDNQAAFNNVTKLVLNQVQKLYL